MGEPLDHNGESYTVQFRNLYEGIYSSFDSETTPRFDDIAFRFSVENIYGSGLIQTNRTTRYRSAVKSLVEAVPDYAKTYAPDDAFSVIGSTVELDTSGELESSAEKAEPRRQADRVLIDAEKYIGRKVNFNGRGLSREKIVDYRFMIELIYDGLGRVNEPVYQLLNQIDMNRKPEGRPELMRDIEFRLLKRDLVLSSQLPLIISHSDRIIRDLQKFHATI